MRTFSHILGIFCAGVAYVGAPIPICSTWIWQEFGPGSEISLDKVVSDSLYYKRDQVSAMGYVSMSLGGKSDNPILYNCMRCVEELLVAFFTTFNQSRAHCISGQPDCPEILQGLSQNFTSCSSLTINLNFPDVTAVERIGQGCTDPQLDSFAAVDSFLQGLVNCAHNDTSETFGNCSTNFTSVSEDCLAVMHDVHSALVVVPSLSSCFMESTLTLFNSNCVRNVLPVFNFFRAASGTNYVFGTHSGEFGVNQMCNSTAVSILNQSVALYPGFIAVGLDGFSSSSLEDVANLVINHYNRTEQGGVMPPSQLADLGCSGCMSDLITGIRSLSQWTSCTVPSGNTACGPSDGAVLGRTESYPYCGSCLADVDSLLSAFALCSGQFLDTTYTEISKPFTPLSNMCSPEVLSPEGFASADVDPVLLLNLALPCALAEPSANITQNCAAWATAADTFGNNSWVYSVFNFPRSSNWEVRSCFDCLDRFILAISSSANAENISQSCWNGTAWDAYANVNSSSCLSELAMPILEFESCTGYITFPNSSETSCTQEEWDSLNGVESMGSLISSALYQTANATSAFHYVLSNLSRPIPPTILDYHCLVCVQELFTDFFNASANNRILCINGEGSSCVDKLTQLEENYQSCSNQTLSLSFPDALSTQLGDGCTSLGSATHELLTQATLISYLYSMYYSVISFTDFINVLGSANSTFNDTSNSCKQAIFDLNQQFAYSFYYFCQSQVSSYECIEKLLLRPLEVFSAATGVGFMFSLPEGQLYKPCPASEWNSFTANVTIYPALVAGGILNDSLINAANFAQEHYDVPPVGDVDVFGEMENLTCNQCLGNFIDNVKEMDLSPSSPCLTPSDGPYCDVNSGVVYGDSLVIYPYCGACISAISTPLLFFDLCSSYNLSTVFTPPEPKFSVPVNQCTGGETELGEFANTLTQLDPFKFVNRALTCAHNDQLVSSECLLENFTPANISTLECVSCIDRLLGDLHAIGNETLQGNCSLANVWDVSLHNCSSLVEIHSVLNTFDSCNGLVRTNIDEILTCSSPVTPEMMSVIETAVSSAMYQANSSAAAFAYVEEALLQSQPGLAVPEFPCLRCLSAFFTAFYSLNGRDLCISDSSPGSACSEAISLATGALNDCSGGQNTKPFTFPNVLTTQLGDGCTALPSPAFNYIDERIGTLISCYIWIVFDSGSQPKIPFDHCLGSLDLVAASPSCHQAFEDFYSLLMNTDPVSGCSGTVSQIECLGILLNGPLMVFSRASGVGYMITLPEGQIYSPCAASDLVNLQSNLAIYPALLAAGIWQDSLSNAMKFAQKFYDYSLPKGASAFEQLENLPCNQCFDNLLQNIAQSGMAGCRTSSNVTNCDASSAVVYGNLTVYPFCPTCLDQMAYPQLFFLFCAGTNFSTSPVFSTRDFPPPSSCSRMDWSAILDDSEFTDAVVYALYEAAKSDSAMSSFLDEFSVRMANNSCINCVIGSIANFTQSDGKMGCISNPASPECINALAGMATNLSDCSGQDVPQLNFPRLCRESEFPAISSVIDKLGELLYREKNIADALSGAQAVVGGGPNTCMDCMGLFLTAFYNSDGRNQCISRHDGQACKDAISGATSAFNNCSGQRLSLSFPTTTCSDDQMNKLVDAGFVSDLAMSFAATDPTIALEIFQTTLALALPEGLTFPCINYCLDDLITSTINLGIDALFICASEIFSDECLNTIKEPVNVYSACSNQNLTAVLAASAPSTSGSSVSIGQVSLSIVLTCLAVLVAFA